MNAGGVVHTDMKSDSVLVDKVFSLIIQKENVLNRAVK